MKIQETQTQTINKTGFDLIDITPELAEAWLATLNPDNRPLSSRRVDQMAHDMLNDEWRITPDCIAFNVNDVLVNGQHRLAAIVKSGKMMRMWVMKGLPLDSFQVTDDVKRRTFGDYLAINNVPSPTSVAALTQRIYVFRNTGQLSLTNINRKATTSDLVNLFDELNTDGLVRAIRRGDRIRHSSMCSGAGANFAMWLIAGIDELEADPFVDEIVKGEEQGRVFRETMLRDKASTRPMSSTNPQVTAALTIKTWNAWREGEVLKLLRWRKGGSNPESFPVPV